MDPTARQSIIDRLKQASNVLVTVKSDPNVDQLAGAIGFTLFLNKLGKHATAVYSGDTPSTLEFLKPEDTLEKTTDSLRDFIIALDKSKADKLRYKVEDNVVRIFITPYRTSITEKDLEFSQGDFNVDVVIALGVHAKEDLDQAIVAHGRILHDATVISINNGPGGNVGTLHLEDPQASSLSEMLVSISEGLQADAFDAQMATAFLTGIVAETNRFSNNKTSPQTMTYSAKLMAAGANQQLIATKLQPGMVAGGANSKKKKDEEAADGTLTIDHEEEKPEPKKEAPISLPEPKLPEPTLAPEPAPAPLAPAPTPTTPLAPTPTSISDVKTDVDEGINTIAPPPPAITPPPTANKFPLQPPTMGGTLTANTQANQFEPTTDPFTFGQSGQTLQHGQVPVNTPKPTVAPLTPAPPVSLTPSPSAPVSASAGPVLSNPQGLDDTLIKDIEKTVGSEHPRTDSTLNEWEQAVGSPHVQPGQAPAPEATTSSLDDARQAVEQAAAASSDTIQPLKAVGSSPLDLDVQGQHAPEPTQTPEPTSAITPPSPTPAVGAPDFLADKGMPPEQTASSNDQPAPPPVPPPLMPPAN